MDDGEMPALLRFLIRFGRPAPDVLRERELLLADDGAARAATLYLPEIDGKPRPAWVLLQGVTVPGRHHEGVRRMARALAAAGHFAVVPEVPSWTRLQVDPREAYPAIRSALALLRSMDEADMRRVGLMGFSVAATWALIAAASELGGSLRAVAGLGAYGDLRRMLRAMVVGEHDWQGRRYQYAPDPYGRWILGADLLPLADRTQYGTREEREAAGGALRRLAYTAGRNGALADTPVYDALIADLRGALPRGALAAWDLLAPPSTQPVPDREAGIALAEVLAEAGARAYPELEPTGRVDEVKVPVVLLHGRGDRLIPFTETLRLASLLPSTAHASVHITGLIGHAKAEKSTARNQLAALKEVVPFARTAKRLLERVET